MLSLWLPILLSAVFVFLLSAVIHMALPWHKNDFKKMPDEDKIRAARSLGASSWQVFSRVILPASLPQTMVGLRVALATALSILVAAELLGGDRGLGFVISDASTFFKTSDVFVGIILIAAIGLLSDRGLAWLGRRYVHWEGRS